MKDLIQNKGISMALTDLEKEWVELTVQQASDTAARKATEEITKRIEDAVKLHIESCPLAKQMGKSKAFIVGIGIGVSFVAITLAGSAKEIWLYLLDKL